MAIILRHVWRKILTSKTLKNAANGRRFLTLCRAKTRRNFAERIERMRAKPEDQKDTKDEQKPRLLGEGFSFHPLRRFFFLRRTPGGRGAKPWVTYNTIYSQISNFSVFVSLF
jgi:hypothetical protein